MLIQAKDLKEVYDLQEYDESVAIPIMHIAINRFLDHVKGSVTDFRRDYGDELTTDYKYTCTMDGKFVDITALGQDIGIYRGHDKRTMLGTIVFNGNAQHEQILANTFNEYVKNEDLGSLISEAADELKIGWQSHLKPEIQSFYFNP